MNPAPVLDYSVDLSLRCPDCNRKLPPLPFMREATLVVRRSCRCGSRWSLKAVPHRLKKLAGYATILEWTRLKEKP
jgi:hypothetical protein